MMINAFLQALGDDDVHKTVYAQNIDVFERVVQLASRMTLAGITSSHRPRSKPSLLRFRDPQEEEEEEAEEDTVARIHALVETRLDQMLKDQARSRRGRSRDTRPNSSVRSVSAGDGSRNRWDRNRRDTSGQRDGTTSRNQGQRDPSQDRSRQASRDRTPGGPRRNPSGGRDDPRPRSASRSRTCFKCQGKGHFIATCPSADWYRPDGTIDEEKTRIENLNKPQDPNGEGPLPRPQ